MVNPRKSFPYICISHTVSPTLVRVGAKQTVLTPFRDGIQNRRQVSVGDRGVLPTRPRNRRGYALLAHTLGKMRSCATGERSNMVIRTIVLKKYNYIGEIISGRTYIPHSHSPLNVSVCIYIPHSHSKENVCARWRNAKSFQENVMCDCSLIQHGLFLETVCVAWGHRPRYFFNNHLQ